MNPNFEMGQNVKIARSGETGRITGFAEYLRSNMPQYLVEYTSADGRAEDRWFHADELLAVE
ncbi:hypothetical protein D2N39_11410 [Gemmobacter lutimaris]|jgi:hypothetical protein|uniref:DUF2862 domain-containing protein n=1 Tax=Gemmobacter lutimaris TaxID=2306023 RepID=A0A398BTQ4_9RHOB|nr:hypothetical protein [Gemmobacter lutimaris]RID91838.1 hypothetical protein D2N39_11410 [Gemmobacter lutimaris]